MYTKNANVPYFYISNTFRADDLFKGLASLEEFRQHNPQIPQDASECIYVNVKMAAAILVYISARHDAVLSGFPGEVSIPHYFGRTPLTIKSPVGDAAVDGTCPEEHYRRWHFKTLRSSRYTKMRGKTIFVRDTIVNRKYEASTVVEKGIGMNGGLLQNVDNVA